MSSFLVGCSYDVDGAVSSFCVWKNKTLRVVAGQWSSFPLPFPRTQALFLATKSRSLADPSGPPSGAPVEKALCTTRPPLSRRERNPVFSALPLSHTPNEAQYSSVSVRPKFFFCGRRFRCFFSPPGPFLKRFHGLPFFDFLFSPIAGGFIFFFF